MFTTDYTAYAVLTVVDPTRDHAASCLVLGVSCLEQVAGLIPSMRPGAVLLLSEDYGLSQWRFATPSNVARHEHGGERKTAPARNRGTRADRPVDRAARSR